MIKAPNLRDAAPRTHKKDCRHAEFLIDRVGDVRQCEHGKIQVVDQPAVYTPGHLVWEDLHPFWNRKAYRLAKQLLHDATPRPGTSSTTTPEAIDRLETNYGDNE